MFEFIKQYYQQGIYSADDVKICVPTWITDEQANQILNAQ